MKKLVWLVDTLARLRDFPAPVQDSIGYALYVAQSGDRHSSAKPLHGLGGGVMEIASNDPGGTYRAVYTVSIGESVYVVHAFQKKSKAGMATPKIEIELVRRTAEAVENRGKECRRVSLWNTSLVQAMFSPI